MHDPEPVSEAALSASAFCSGAWRFLKHLRRWQQPKPLEIVSAGSAGRVTLGPPSEGQALLERSKSALAGLAGRLILRERARLQFSERPDRISGPTDRAAPKGRVSQLGNRSGVAFGCELGTPPLADDILLLPCPKA